MNRQPARRSLFHTLLSALAGKASEQAKQHLQPPRRPAPDDRDAWLAHWEEQSQPWRTEPEIDEKRQEYLAQRHITSPDIEHGIYPFKDVKLNRADIEWLLATHENGRGPVDWSDASQRKRQGLDLRGADLRQVDLRRLPLARLHGGLSKGERDETTEEENIMAAVLLDGANLREAHLEGAKLYRAHLEGACLYGTHLKEADLACSHLKKAGLSGTHLEKAYLSSSHLEEVRFTGLTILSGEGSLLEEGNFEAAHLEGAYLFGAYLKGAHLAFAHLERTSLRFAHLERADLERTHLEGANLDQAHLEEASLRWTHLEEASLYQAHLEGANLQGANLEGADLKGAHLGGANFSEAILCNEKHIGPRLADAQWGNVNLTIIDWSRMTILGDEHQARQKKHSTHGASQEVGHYLEGQIKVWDERLKEYEAAVRANRQLAVALQTQGLNEIAARFAYRAQVLQKQVYWFQLIQPQSRHPDRLRIQTKPRVQFKQRMQALGAWLFSWFLYLLAGYGYKPGRSFLAYLVVIGTFMSIYLLLDPHLAWYEAIVVSMTAFHGRGFSPSTFSPGDPLSIASAIEAFVGLIIEVTFIATLTRRFFGQ